MNTRQIHGLHRDHGLHKDQSYYKTEHSTLNQPFFYLIQPYIMPVSLEL